MTQHTALRMRQYQQQAVSTATPDQLIAKLYDFGIAACLRDDRTKLRAVLQELISSLNFEGGGEIAERLFMLYEYFLNESVSGDLPFVAEMLSELRDVWKEYVITRKAA